MDANAELPEGSLQMVFCLHLAAAFLTSETIDHPGGMRIVFLSVQKSLPTRITARKNYPYTQEQSALPIQCGYICGGGL